MSLILVIVLKKVLCQNHFVMHGVQCVPDE
jgi:hypothetical protein